MVLRYDNEVKIPVGRITLMGNLSIPFNANSIVIFSHGSGSSRYSPRNKLVADHLHLNNIGTLLFDLLTAQEDELYQNRFDVELLTKRLIGATEWLETLPDVKDCRLGYFGASTGAASALKATAHLSQIGAVVSRGGRPDLAMDALSKVEAPTLLIVGSLDYDVLQLNEEAYQKLTCEKKLEIIEDATHLFEEKGTMGEVVQLAIAWFQKYLQPVKANS